ncbi:Mov34/MPN/PAD-1 family protein [Vulgatibacter sp.]|uniref:Mov34/MPN/PAD-1 family protein n=1 Tax=Vulgatibacter sp. TaxID=1971226 RepID=UPI003563F950
MREALAAAAAHLCATWPLEGCGAVVRAPGGACHFVAIPNVARTPEVAFAFEPRAQLELFRNTAAGAVELVALVHSHVGAPADFSEEDRAAATTVDGRPLHPGLEHWVLAVYGPPPAVVEARAFTWRVDGWSERPLVPPPAAGAPSCARPANRL